MGVSASKEIETIWFDDYVTSNLPSSCFEGKTIVITGCTSGTGYVLAETCVMNNAGTVLLLNRNSDRSIEAQKKLQEIGISKNSRTTIETIPCNLQDFANVREAIKAIQSKYDSIDVLCNNAGVMALEDVATVDGYDIQIQTNHLSHFLLTKELYPLLESAVKLRGEARIVHHTSYLRNHTVLQPQYFEKNGGNLGGNGSLYPTGARWKRYCQSKLANSAFTFELSQRITKDSGIKAVVAAPGHARTALQETAYASGGMNQIGMFVTRHMGQSQKDGTMPLVAACFHPDTANGDFYEPSGPRRRYGLPMKVTYDGNSLDPDQRKMLWTKSEEACGVFSK